jgi:hypothetical protein
LMEISKNKLATILMIGVPLFTFITIGLIDSPMATVLTLGLMIGSLVFFWGLFRLLDL